MGFFWCESFNWSGCAIELAHHKVWLMDGLKAGLAVAVMFPIKMKPHAFLRI